MKAITRTVGCSINTVTKLLENAGAYLGEFQDRTLRDLPCSRLEVDEAWAFVYPKNRNRSDRQGCAGRRWRRVDVDRYLRRHEAHPDMAVGDRTTGTAIPFMDDLRSRLRYRVQLTTGRAPPLPRSGTLKRSAATWTTRCS